MESEWKTVKWGPDPEPIDIDKLNAMGTDLEYLYSRLPKMTYTAYSTITKNTGVKIACGVVSIPPVEAYHQSSRVLFGGFFTPGCKPIIAISLVSPDNRRVTTSLTGLDGPSTRPDHRGFVGHCNTVEYNDKTSYIRKTMWLNWIAMGY